MYPAMDITPLLFVKLALREKEARGGKRRESVQSGQEGRGGVGIDFKDCKCKRGKCNIIDQSRIALVQCIERNFGVTNDKSNGLVRVDRLPIKMTNIARVSTLSVKERSEYQGDNNWIYGKEQEMNTKR
jgi:hypothetical protein